MWRHAWWRPCRHWPAAAGRKPGLSSVRAALSCWSAPGAARTSPTSRASGRSTRPAPAGHCRRADRRGAPARDCGDGPRPSRPRRGRHRPEAQAGQLAVLKIWGCSVGGVAAIRRTIDAVRQDLGAFGGAQREPALVEQNGQADRLGDDQGGQQQSDQLGGEAARPERPQDPPQPPSCAFDVGRETVAAAPVRLDQGRLPGSRSILRRSRLTWLSTLRSNTFAARPRVDRAAGRGSAPCAGG